ncbi:MAG: hypothetical protein OEX00_05010 [Gammaproteobacteria bacterium]|nr:hypothetical protein [Gammaproteobacteria bacterium]MDH5692138.1 hypothetical protein [Gammaproteobacteria bacterium]
MLKQFPKLTKFRALAALSFFYLLQISTNVTANSDAQLSYYWDNRDFNTTTLQLSASDLGGGLSFWGFTDFHSDQNNADKRYDNSRTFSEYRLSSNSLGEVSGIDGLALQAEYNDFTTGNNNTTWRGGLTYKQQSGFGWAQLRILPVQSEGQGQISLIYFVKINDWMNFSGFADYNFLDENQEVLVAEPQFNLQLFKRTWGLIEYRYNGFEAKNPALKGEGWAVGLRHDF